MYGSTKVLVRKYESTLFRTKVRKYILTTFTIIMLPSKVSCYFRTFESTFVLSYIATKVHTKVLSYYIVLSYFRT